MFLIFGDLLASTIKTNAAISEPTHRGKEKKN